MAAQPATIQPNGTSDLKEKEKMLMCESNQKQTEWINDDYMKHVTKSYHFKDFQFIVFRGTCGDNQ